MAELTPLSAETLGTLCADFESNAANRLAMNAVTAAGIDKVARNYDRARLLQRRFSVTVDNGTVTHQDRSGRCWLFSSLNVARFVAKKNMGLKEFEFSQNYAMYFDKLERINYFLKDMAALVEAGEPADSRLVQHLLADVMGDGGQWTMAMNVYKKYGAVPKDLFPETESSKNTGPMNTQLRSMLHTEVARMFADPSKIDEIVAEGVAAGHRILTIHLGEPPKSFDWEWTDEKGEFHRDGEITPVEFWNKYVDAGLEDYVCLVDDPRAEHPKGKKIAIEHLGNVAGGDPTEYLNVPNQFMKDCVRRILSEQGIPVWFGADCHPMMDRESGAWAARGELLGRQDRRQGLLHDERRLVHRVRVRGGCAQEHAARGVPEGPRGARHLPARLGPHGCIGLSHIDPPVASHDAVGGFSYAGPIYYGGVFSMTVGGAPHRQDEAR